MKLELFYDQTIMMYVWSDGLVTETKERPPMDYTVMNHECKNCGAPKLHQRSTCEYCKS